MKIATAASAFPKHYYSNNSSWPNCRNTGVTALQSANAGAVASHVAVEGRYLAMPCEKYNDLNTWGHANDVWIQVAQELGEQALCRALLEAQFDRARLGALFFTSVTGISSPSIDALLINRMGLPANIRRVPIFGLGCVAGAAGIARAADYVRAYPIAGGCPGLGGAVLVDHSTRRSLGSQLDFLRPVWRRFRRRDCHRLRTECGGPEILATRSIFYPQTEQMMGWKVSEKGFRIVSLARGP